MPSSTKSILLHILPLCINWLLSAPSVPQTVAFCVTPSRSAYYYDAHQDYSHDSYATTTTAQAPKYRRRQLSTELRGKLWDKLQVEPDPMDEDSQWYVMNCVVGQELELLGQSKHVTKNISRNLIEKISVPTERALRSHGKTGNVVEIRVKYPGYVFVKMKLCAETYEPLEELPLCRSWMAGTVNRKGYKKLPPVPIALSDDEIEKFQGLNEETDAMYKEFGDDYDGRGDKGLDLIEQYQGYEVEGMVKILSGNFKGEDGIIRRLKDGLVCVRLYTYGTVNDQWFRPDEIRPMTDAEAMKGLTGPNLAIGQEDFDKMNGTKKNSVNRSLLPKRMDGDSKGSSLRSNLMQSVAGNSVTNRRMRRQDKIGRGEYSGINGVKTDIFGRTGNEAKKEEENWKSYRDDKRLQQQQRTTDSWGIKERTSWSGSGDNPLTDVDAQWGRSSSSSRDSSVRQDRRTRQEWDSRKVEDALLGGDDWNKFAGNKINDGKASKEDDFFNNLMSELSDNFKSPSSNVSKKGAESSSRTKVSSSSSTEDDDFFNALMSDLSGALKSPPVRNSASAKTQTNVEDDFFASLEADLNDSLGKSVVKDDALPTSRTQTSDGIVGKTKPSSVQANTVKSAQDEVDDFFMSLEQELQPSSTSFHDSQSSTESAKQIKSKETDHVEKAIDSKDLVEEKSTAGASNIDMTKLTVPMLKTMLKERGLKLSGTKSELISRLQQQSH